MLQSADGDSLNSSVNKIPLFAINSVIPNSLNSTNNHSGEFDPLKNNVDYTLLAYTGGLTLAVGTGLHIYQANAWWQEQDSKFRIINDWNYSLWQDKLGHFYGTNLIAHALAGALEAANVQTEESTVISGLTALAFELFIEIEDGFGPQWGFSPGDATANVLGAGFFISQYYFPIMKNFLIKASYYPSPKFLAGQHKGGIIIDDHEGWKYWMSVRVKELLPRKAAEYWPSFLMIAGGMGVDNLDGVGGGRREFYIALDYDMETLPLYGGFWQFFKSTFNYWHFPMPGIRVTQGGAFFVLSY